jgi:hypothetical protein
MIVELRPDGLGIQRSAAEDKASSHACTAAGQVFDSAMDQVSYLRLQCVRPPAWRSVRCTPWLCSEPLLLESEVLGQKEEGMLGCNRLTL